MSKLLRPLFVVLTACTFCVGTALAFDWRVLLLLKLVPVLLAIDWLRVAALPGHYRSCIVLGLCLSLIGDALLALPNDQFIAGLIAFLCAHLAYVAAYLMRTRHPAWPWLLLAGVAVSGFLFVLDTRGSLGMLRLPVFVYAVVIGTMLWRAGSLMRLDLAGRLAILGAVLFVASDMVLAWNRFVAPDPILRYINILLYWAGQWGIAASAVRLRRSGATRL